MTWLFSQLPNFPSKQAIRENREPGGKGPFGKDTNSILLKPEGQHRALGLGDVCTTATAAQNLEIYHESTSQGQSSSLHLHRGGSQIIFARHSVRHAPALPGNASAGMQAPGWRGGSHFAEPAPRAVVLWHKVLLCLVVTTLCRDSLRTRGRGDCGKGFLL